MKTIAVAGAARHVGKTTLVRRLGASLAPLRVAAIKVGHGVDRPEKPERLFHDVAAARVHLDELRQHGETDVGVVESSTLATTLGADLTVFIDSPTGDDKPGAAASRAAADLVIGRDFHAAAVRALVEARLGTARPVEVLAQQHAHLFGAWPRRRSVPDDALRTILAHVARPGAEHVSSEDALGRVTAEAVASPLDLPPFTKAAMDGYACGGDPDTTGRYRVVATLPAGHGHRVALRSGECARIMTGAMMPEGADRLVCLEHTRAENEYIVLTKSAVAHNIVLCGENRRAGETLLPAGAWLRAQELATLAAVGLTTLAVVRRPRVGVLVTGSELVPPGSPLTPGCIYDSNGRQIVAQATVAGAEPVNLGVVADDAGAITERLRAAVATCDVVVLSGGVGKGDCDHAHRALAEAGVEILIDGLAMKPGRPLVFGRAGTTPVFALPGNPVAAWLLFYLLVEPLLAAMTGRELRRRVLAVELADPIARKRSDRVEFVPVALEGRRARPVTYHGSGHINALCETDAWLRLEGDTGDLPAGARVDVLLL